MRRIFSTLILLFLFLALPNLGWSVLVIKNENRVILPVERHNDLVVINSEVVLHGVVRGSVVGINSKIVLSQDGMIRSSITLTNSELHSESEASLPNTIVLTNSKMFVDETQIRSSSGLKNRKINLSQHKTKISKKMLHEMQSMLTFERPYFKNSDLIQTIKKIEIPQINDDPVKTSGFEKFSLIPGLISVNLDKKVIPVAVRGLWEDYDRKAKVTFMKARNTQVAQKVFNIFHNPSREKYFDYSYHSSLGNGNHWFFAYKGWEYVIWQERQYLGVIQVKVNYPYSAGETRDFLLQVTRQIRQYL